MSEAEVPAGAAKPLPAPGSVGAWVLAARPKTLVAGWAPVFAGTSVAFVAASVVPIRALAALVVAVSIQIGTNLVNDAADHKRGADDAGRLGPPRAVAMGLLTGRKALMGGLACFGLAGFAGLWLAAVVNWWLLVPGALALLSGYFYTGGPRPLAYLGFGELFVFVFFGLFAVLGTAYVQTGVLTQLVERLGLWWGAAFGLLAVCILEVNNLRDAPKDSLVGKRTVAVRIGDSRARVLLQVCVFGAFLALALGVGTSVLSEALLLLPLLVLPLAFEVANTLRSGATGRALNPVLGMVARLEAWFAVLLFAGAMTTDFLIRRGVLS